MKNKKSKGRNKNYKNYQNYYRYNKIRREREKEEEENVLLYRGDYSGTSGSYGFVKLSAKTNTIDMIGVDIFIPEENNKIGAIQDDEVLIKIVPASSPNAKTEYEGIIVRIVKRNFVWCISALNLKDGEYFVVADKKRKNSKVYINRKNLNGATPGDIVKVVLLNASVKFSRLKKPRRPRVSKDESGKVYGEVTEILGKQNSLSANCMGILLSHGITPRFDDNVIETAKQIAADGLSNMMNCTDREDLREKIVFTIDSSEAKDLDDAISIEIDEDKNYILGVHIADVSHYVEYKSILDIEAYARGTSIYFIDNVVPMLPESLSNGICSLNEGQDRLCLSAFMTIDKKGETIKSRFAKTIIHSKIKGIYSEINAIFADIYKNSDDDSDGDKDNKLERSPKNIIRLKKKYEAVMPELKKAWSLAQILNKRRIKKGALEFAGFESKFIMEQSQAAETGEPIIADIKKAVQGNSENLIEEFMLKANEAVAEFLSRNKYPCVYRVHEEPFVEKIEEFADTLKRFGCPPNLFNNIISKEKGIHPKDLQKILNYFRGTPLFDTISSRMLRALAKAKYNESNCGHFGLSSREYCHFTSPIRRYPDLVNHRILKMALAEDKNTIDMKEIEHMTALASKQSTEREMNAVSVEREVTDLYKAVYMSRHIGKIYDGIITSVTNFGAFVMLENTCEGLVRVSDMRGYFEFDSAAMELRNGGERYGIGQKVQIKVIGVDISAGVVSFIFWD